MLQIGVFVVKPTIEIGTFGHGHENVQVGNLITIKYINKIRFHRMESTFTKLKKHKK